MRSLKGLESVIQLVVMDFHLTDEGWTFTGNYGSDPKDPLYGFTKIKDLYLKANPDYDQRYTVPLLWDKQQETVVNNESSEIIRMLYTAFDSFLPEDRRETARPMLPEKHKEEIEAMNEWVSHCRTFRTSHIKKKIVTTTTTTTKKSFLSLDRY